MRALRGNDIAMIFQEPMTVAQSGASRSVTRSPKRSDCIGASVAARRAQQAIEMLRVGRDPGARAPGRRVSAPAERWHAPARHDRDGAVVPAAPADRRRADDGARRHDSGADSRPARRRCSERLGMALLLVTHDLGVVAERADDVGDHVCRAASSSSGPVADGLRAPAASLHARPAAVRSHTGDARKQRLLESSPELCPTCCDLPSRMPLSRSLPVAITGVRAMRRPGAATHTTPRALRSRASAPDEGDVDDVGSTRRMSALLEAHRSAQALSRSTAACWSTQARAVCARSTA